MKTFRDAVRTTDFAISAQLFLRADTDAAALRAQVDLLRDAVDGILLTDNQFGQLHMSPLVAAALLLELGTDPIVQLSSRNRNRIALVSDLLGAAALGVTSLLLVAGERAPDGFKPKPKPVMDLNATELIRTAAAMNANEDLRQYPDFLIGGMVTPVLPKPGWQATTLRDKVTAGAHFVQTHICHDMDLLRRYLEFLVANKLIHQARVIASVAVLGSADDAIWVRNNRPNAMIPDAVVARLAAASDPRREGIRIGAETVAAMRDIPGIAGVNIMAARDLSAIPEVIRAAASHG